MPVAGHTVGPSIALVWAGPPSRSSASVQELSDPLGEERRAQIIHVSSDGADLIGSVVEQMRSVEVSELTLPTS